MAGEVVSACRSVLERIRAAEARSSVQRHAPVQLICVSKRQSVSAMQTLIDSGLFPGHGPIFGENYVQEFAAKRPVLSGSFGAHCIGNLQSNKVRKAVTVFDTIQTVDSKKLAITIDREAEKAGRCVPCFLQINISHDTGKSGLLPEEVTPAFLQTLQQLAHIRVAGLMTITRLYENPEAVRPDFRALREFRDMLKKESGMTEPLLLSMGMSADFEIAIEEGADLVRVGSAIFGERSS